MNLQEIKKLAEQRHYEKAIQKCEELLRNFPENTSDILRTRAYIYSLLGSYEKALKDREEILSGTSDVFLKDYYAAGDNALSLGKYSKALVWFEEVLRLGKEQNETWFESAAYFLLAYAQMELGHYEEAIKNLDSAISCEPDCSMPLPNLGVWDHEQLRKEIQNRSGKIE